MNSGLKLNVDAIRTMEKIDIVMQITAVKNIFEDPIDLKIDETELGRFRL